MVLKLKLEKQINLQLQQALNPQTSQNFGRRIYSIDIDDQRYWLKLQLKNVSSYHEGAFIHELNQYELIYRQSDSVLAPFQIIQLSDFIVDANYREYFRQGLIVADLPLLFSDISVLSKREIVTRLHLSIEILEKLHSLQIIHGDLKVEHFRQHQGHSVFIDLEQSFHFTEHVKQQNTATPRYMAPELFHAEPKTIQTDLYALGIIWLEWLTQQKLQAKTYHDWAILHCQSLNPTLNAEFYEIEPILKQLLMKNKLKRCTNFYQIKQQLSQIV